MHAGTGLIAMHHVLDQFGEEWALRQISIVLLEQVLRGLQWKHNMQVMILVRLLVGEIGFNQCRKHLLLGT